MKRALPMVVLLCVAVALAMAAPLDGKWIAKMERKSNKGQVETVEFTLDLKVQGNQLTGTVTGGSGRRPASMTIENGKIEGNRFSFTTVQRSRKGEQKFIWEGTISGDELRGTRTPEGRRRGAEFTAKRAS